MTRFVASVLGLALLAIPSLAHADESAGQDSLPPPPPTIPTVKSHVRVHLDSKTPVQLESRAPGANEWSKACDAPCDRNLPLDHQYRIVDGAGGAAGKSFSLDAGMGSKVTVTHEPTSQAGRVGGTVIVVVGGGLAALSLVGVVGGGSLALTGPSCEKGSNDWCGLGQAIGVVVLIVSSAGLLLSGGIIAGGLAVRSGAAASHTQRPTAVREPTWLGPQSAASSRSGFVLPLSFSF